MNGLLGLQQLKRLDENNLKRSRNLNLFLAELDPNVFQTDFRIQGNSNYAFTLVLRKPDFLMRDRVEKLLAEAKIEFRRGLSGGGNQLRQPYLRKLSGLPTPESMPNTDHVHHYAWYIGNYPELGLDQIQRLGKILRSI